jgi:hypothetical protein
MGQRGVVLSAVAKVLNAGGSRLVDLYDAVALLKEGRLPRGEKGEVKARLRECKARLERVYIDIGSDVALNEPTEAVPAAREAAIERAAEYRAEIATLTKRLQDLERAQQAARDAAALVTPRIKAERPATEAPPQTPASAVIQTGGVPAQVTSPDAAEPVALSTVFETAAPIPDESSAGDAPVERTALSAVADDIPPSVNTEAETPEEETDTRSER